MRFIHIADCHLDGYREEKLNQLSLQNFKYCIDFAIKNKVDFVLMAGDLFNTALPKIDTLKDTTTILKKLKDSNIPMYSLPGSHDYSPNGKTMLDVLENAGLMRNVYQGKITPDGSLMLDWTIDLKTGAHLTGILGKKGMLDKEYYQKLDYNNLQSENFRIFMFHTAITELKPKELEMMESYPLDLLPPGFDYYAGGHVHIRKQYNTERYANVIYPGPTFPNNFGELEKLKAGSFVYFEDGHVAIKQIPSKEVFIFNFDCNEKSASRILEYVEEEIAKEDLKDKIVLMRFKGIISEGKTQEIDFKLITRHCMDKGAYIVLKNTSKLKNKEFQEVVISEESADAIEENTITANLNQINLPEEYNEKEIISELIKFLETEQYDGEKKSTFNERLVEETKRILKTNF